MLKPRKERIFEARQRRMKIRRMKLTGILAATVIILAVIFSLNEQSSEAATYKVKKNDTLYRIAKKHNLSVEELKIHNQLVDNYITVGQTLDIPYPTNYQGLSGEPFIHIVAPGETLWRIAGRYGLSVEELKTLNNLKDNHINAFQPLTIIDEMYTSQAKLIGAADDRVLEFQADEEFFTLLAPLQSASRLQAFTGQDLFITYKKNSLLSIHSTQTP
ncbi:LysM peptidoglycan-binding domain-containing protein [Cytobacillus kochii]|uniref:LysM peptidoglycan-binding domain-containing protein n=1 Tax=Cytobacillus sp. FSL K6-0129 TaxID=2921421 RepID=UPI002E23290B|nr:LysM peptidoglycan-binding domain-containing protein [Cytobacillus kochii]